MSGSLPRVRATRDTLLQLARASSEAPLNYAPVGFTRGAVSSSPPKGYRIDHYRTRLGSGADTFARARAQLTRGRMFELGWVKAAKHGAGFAEGDAIVVAVRVLGLWWLNVSRIVYTLDAKDSVARFGFAYGTTDLHAERGEERFVVEWNLEDDSVWYDVYAVSRPNRWFVWLTWPLARRYQLRFGRDTLREMERAVASEMPPR